MHDREHRPSSPPDELSLGATAAEARRASEWLDATCQRRGVPLAQTERLLLCLEEALANVLAHGKPAPAEPIVLRFETTLGVASVTVSDAGRAFDPLSVPRRVAPRTLDEASTGGMGLQLIRRCADLLQYRHQDGRNHLTFGTRWG